MPVAPGSGLVDDKDAFSVGPVAKGVHFYLKEELGKGIDVFFGPFGEG